MKFVGRQARSETPPHLRSPLRATHFGSASHVLFTLCLNDRCCPEITSGYNLPVYRLDAAGRIVRR
jgi:hypothetical protein